MVCHLACSDWRLQLIGRAIKLRRGSSGRVAFTLVPGEREDEIEVSVFENPNDLNVLINPERITLSGSCAEVIVDIEVPTKTSYKPVWILGLEFKGSRKTSRGFVAVFPVNEKSHKKTIREAIQDDKTFAVGAPGFIKAGKYYLSYRWRNGNEERGRRLEIAESSDGLEYVTLKYFDKKDYSYASFEQACFVKGSPSNVVFLYSADVGRTWNIYVVEGKHVDDITLPGRLAIADGKDPASLYDQSSDSYIVAYSNCKNPGHDLAVISTKDFEKFEIESASIFYTQLIGQGNSWARTHIHVGSLFKVDGYYVLFYDALPSRPSSFGSGWLGVAISRDLKKWIDLTPDKPLWQGKGIDKTFRYVDVYFDRDSYILYAEEEVTARGRKDLVAYYDLP